MGKPYSPRFLRFFLTGKTSVAQGIIASLTSDVGHWTTIMNLYLAPFFMEVALGIATIAIPLLAINLGADSLKLGILGFTVTLFYIGFCLPFGKLSDRWGRKGLILLGCLVYSLTSLAFSLSHYLYQVFLFLPFLGISGAMFWPSMEAWITERDRKRSLVRKISFFNISWSTGMAVGPLAGGIFFQLNPRFPFYLASLFSLLIGFLILKQPHQLKKEISSPGPDYPGKDPPARSLSYLYAGWMANFVAWLSLGMIRYLFPKLSVEMGIQPGILGTLIFSLATSQTITFYLLGKVSRWHYRLMPLLCLQMLAVFAFILIFLSHSLPILFLAFVLIGMGGGMTYSSSLFYSLNTPRDKGTKSGIHETILGSGGLIGPLAGGILAQTYTLKAPYLLAAFIIGAGMIGEILLIRRKK